MTKYEENVKQLEDMIFELGYTQPSPRDWANAIARYVLAEKAESYEKGWIDGRKDYDEYIPEEHKTIAIYLAEIGLIEEKK